MIFAANLGLKKYRFRLWVIGEVEGVRKCG